MGKMYKINAALDYVQGHLRYGHLEGTVELTDEELEKLKKRPNEAKYLDLNTVIDDYSVDDIGDVCDISITELNTDKEAN